MANRGRPSIFTQELADEICRRLADGETLRAICRDDDMPARSTVISWVLAKEKQAFSDQYARAREIGYGDMAEELMEIADDTAGDPARDRLRVDARKWMLSKALPKIYGDRVTADINAKVEDVTERNPLEIARRMGFLLSAGVQRPDEPDPLH